jgi:hypothetical protein
MLQQTPVYRLLPVLLLALFAGAWSPSFAQGRGEGRQPLPQLRCGVVIEDIFNIDYKSSTIEAIFWLWVRSTDGPYPIADYLDIKGATETSMSAVMVDTLLHEGKIHYLTQAEFHVELLTDLDDSRYPLDKQHVELIIELFLHYAADVQLIIDSDDLSIRPEFVQTWRVENSKASVIETQTSSNFGYFTEKASSYKALKVEYDLVRDQLPLFIKVFFVVFISFFLAAISFFLPNSKSEEKISLIIGALFTAIGNMYIVSSSTGERPELGLLDEIHLTTFTFLLFFAAMAIVEQRGSWKNNLRFDVLMFGCSTLLYAGLVTWMCLN